MEKSDGRHILPSDLGESNRFQPNARERAIYPL